MSETFELRSVTESQRAIAESQQAIAAAQTEMASKLQSLLDSIDAANSNQLQLNAEDVARAAVAEQVRLKERADGLRDHMAIEAMRSLIGAAEPSPEDFCERDAARVIAVLSYEMADAMLSARGK
jgi:hypothetical protein